MTLKNVVTEAGLILAREHPRQRAQLYRLVEAGRLQIVVPGVLALPGVVSRAQLLRALCLWCPRGVVHERTALAVWLGEPVGTIYFAGPVKRLAPAGVVFTCRQVPEPLIRHRAGIRVVTPAYAAAECAAWDEGRSLLTGLREGLVHTGELQPALAALAGTAGNGHRAAIVRAAERNPWSYAELLLHRVLLDAGIEGWVANCPIRINGRRYVPDLCLPSHLLILEFDGYAEHSKRQQFRDDRERQNALVTAGYRVLRFTWEDLTQRPTYIVDTVRRAISLTASA